MCGIVGGVRLRGAASISEMVGRMQAVQRHRGPDNQSEWVTDAVGLGSARLSIIDLSSAGDQPMITADGRYVLVYNGELYNFRELRADLERQGVRFRSASDTEVVLEALARGADAALPRFDGMFALALVDRKAGTLLLARDRSGIKPVHYLKSPEAFLFASEVKSIWSAVGPGGLAPDRERLREVISLGYPYGTTTPFQGVRTLPGGMALELDLATGDFSIRTFHDLLGDLTAEAWREREGRSEERVEKDLETAVSASVTAHLVSDAPVGVICSGGVDSSLIAAMAVRQVPNLELFHAAVEGPGSEEPYARLVAGHIGAKLHVAPVGRKEFLRAWPRAVFHNDFPSYHPNDAPLYIVCQLARDRGVKVLLSGEGADELFGGYRVNLELRARRRWRRILKRLPGRFSKHVKGLVESQLLSSSYSGFRWFADMTGLTAIDRANFFIASEALFQADSERLQRGLAIRDRLAFLEEAERAAAGFLTERVFGHMGSLLMRNDRMGMMASIETRIPYLSNGLLAEWMPMPLRFRIQERGHLGLKFLLKRIARRYLPSSISDRPKVGFGIPLSRFLRPRFEIFKGGFLEDQLAVPAKAIGELCPDATAFYRLGSLELWGRFFFRGESPEEWSQWAVDHC